ncbi:TonB-dependent receptor domain-containing protein [Hephaestia mangrovi]|uniref:TonB-dependent receptor domain-containing protein n=1 Tax=Hephaestia mangrovi TaxID=2873268 RepID=UPI002104158B|nr:TonB-dependent receptor [Hephaestia mangrovi]
MMLVALALGTPVRAAPAVRFDIPKASLADALALFARQSKRQLLFSPFDVRGRRASPVHGLIDPDDALRQLLAGTGFHSRRAPGGAYLLVEDRVAEPALPSPAPAPSLQPASPPPDIVVVGTAGGGSLRQEAAFAVTTIDADQIERLAPASTADVLKLVPGLTVETSGGKNGANIFVRGYPSGGDAEYVTFQTDGVPFFPPATLSFLENSQLYRIDETIAQVEAVRGGTGSLFASGQPGVTINLVQREGGRTLQGLAKASVIDDGEVRGDGYVSGPLGPDTQFLAGGYYSRGRGIRSPGYAADRGGQITANLRHDFADGTAFVFARYLDDRSQWLLPIPVEQHGTHIGAYPGFDAGSGTLAGPDTRRGVLNDGEAYDLDDGRGARIGNIGGNLELHVSDGVTVRDKLSWLGGHADTTGLVSSDVPPKSAAAYAAALGGSIGSLTNAANGDAVSPNQQVVEAGVWKVRKRIAAYVNDATIEWKTGRHKATIGLYTTRFSSRDHWNTGNDLLLTATPHAHRLNMTLADGRVVTRDGFSSGASFRVNADYVGRDTAFYAVDEWQVNDQIRIDGGVRYQDHRADGTIEDSAPAGSGGLDGDPATLYDNGDMVLDGQWSKLRYRHHAWSWTAGINDDLGRHLSVFARYSRGHSFPFFDNLRDGLDVAPRIDTYEGGAKLTSRPISLYATLFHNRFHGLATTVITNGAPLASVGGARATGIELEGEAHPAAHVSIAFSGSWLDARYHDFFTDRGTTDLSGNRVQRQPEWQWRLTPAYETEIAGRKARASLTLAYMGARFSDVQNQQVLPHFYTLDAVASIELTSRLRIQANATNLTNTIGLTEGNPRMLGPQGNGAIFGRPILGRSLQLSASYGF